jgi:hypothetical protein
MTNTTQPGIELDLQMVHWLAERKDEPGHLCLTQEQIKLSLGQGLEAV